MPELEVEEEGESSAKTTVQSTASGKAVCERLQNDGYFSDAQSVFRFAVCFALANEIQADPDYPNSGGGKGFTWSVTGLDPNQVLKLMVTEFSNGERLTSQREQYRRIETLGNLGLSEIGRRLEAGSFISELIN